MEKKIVFYWNTKKLIVFICGFLLLPTFLIFALSLTLRATLANPQYYKNNLKKVDAYNRIINEGIPSLILEVQISDNQLTDSLAKEISTFLIQKLVDPVWLEGTANKFIDETISYFENPKHGIVLNLTEEEKYIKKLSNGLLVLEEIIPNCDQKEEPPVAKATLLNFSLDCGESAQSLKEIKQDLKGIRQGVDKINLGVVELDQTVQKANSFIQNISKFLRYTKIYFKISLAVILILIVTIIALEWKNPAFALKLIASFTGIASLVNLSLSFVCGEIVPKSLGNQEIILSSAMRSITDDFLGVTISGIFQYWMVVSFIVLVISSGFYLTALILDKKHLLSNNKK